MRTINKDDRRHDKQNITNKTWYLMKLLKVIQQYLNIYTNICRRVCAKCRENDVTRLVKLNSQAAMHKENIYQILVLNSYLIAATSFRECIDFPDSI